MRWGKHGFYLNPREEQDPRFDVDLRTGRTVPEVAVGPDEGKIQAAHYNLDREEAR